MKYLFLGLFVFLTFPVSAGIPDSGKLEFEVLRNGNPFGTHTLNFTQTNDGLTRVDINIDMSVSAGPIDFFKYTHRNTELWDGNKLVGLSSETNDDGDDYFVNASWGDDVFKIQSSSKNQELPKPIMSTSYWHSDFVKQTQLLNSQKGLIDTIVIQSKEKEVVNDRPAIKYIIRVNDDRDITIWYDVATNQWVGLEFTIKNQNISYQRVTEF